MLDSKIVKDLMIDVFEYPHVPYWFSIRQAITIVRLSFSSTRRYPEPMVILVFNERYNLLGTLTIKDILKGLDPRVLKPTPGARRSAEDESGVALWDELLNKESRERAEKPVSEIMVPAKFFVEPEDPITKAAYLMLRHDLIMLPVLEDKKKFVGLVRMRELFEEISAAILKE